METALVEQVLLSNPWLVDKNDNILTSGKLIPRLPVQWLLKPDWDPLCTVLVGPRQSGKTTIGKYICQVLVNEQRFPKCLYLNCDFPLIKEWLSGPEFIVQAQKRFNLDKYILFIDEVQRLLNPGLLLKMIIDLNLPIKLIASGSSQLEIKSKLPEFLTGRQIEATIYPLSCLEVDFKERINDILIFGAYPQIYKENEKRQLLYQLYETYISKDIIEILRLSKPDIMRKLIGLLAHCSGQLLNYQQLAADCRVNVNTINNYIEILKSTYIIDEIKPFVGNKRTELTSNPVCYFIDNGFRNQALNNFISIESRTDNGLLVESLVYQEICKYNANHMKQLTIYYWRTKGGAEVDFVIEKNSENYIPVEVKYRNMSQAKISRGFRSFIQAYSPKIGIIVTKNLMSDIDVDGCKIYFIPLDYLPEMLKIFEQEFKL